MPILSSNHEGCPSILQNQSRRNPGATAIEKRRALGCAAALAVHVTSGRWNSASSWNRGEEIKINPTILSKSCVYCYSDRMMLLPKTTGAPETWYIVLMFQFNSCASCHVSCWNQSQPPMVCALCSLKAEWSMFESDFLPYLLPLIYISTSLHQNLNNFIAALLRSHHQCRPSALQASWHNNSVSWLICKTGKDLDKVQIFPVNMLTS